ncbi:MAG: polysaccharide biosynthesis protein [Prevotella sp.]|nr:polysaccharide biosynthesis protein [Candidatus Equicola stercoris]
MENRQPKKIAKNTLLLFMRMFVLMLINLYAVRLLLSALGEEDYGIFNVVAGVVTMLSCMGTVLALATQRFYSDADGKKDYKRLKEIFSASINLNIGLSFIILIVFETIGLWFLNVHLNIPDDRMFAVQCIYQFSIFTFICSILQIPYMSAVIAHEHMGIYTIISTVECLLRLIVVCLIAYASIDGLIFYGGGLFLVSILIFLTYAITANRKYAECHYQKVKNKSLYKEFTAFSGWTLFGSVASIGMVQGNTILLNLFFGPITNAAFAIALQINNAFAALCNSVVMALRPAMIRSYASNDRDYLQKLFNTSNKFLFFILIAIGVPLISEMYDILNIWLGDFSEEMVLFSRMIIVYVIILAMHNPITIIMHASGKVKYYHLISESVMIVCFPLSLILFLFGMPSYTVLVCMISVCALAHVVRMFCLKYYQTDFSIRRYLLSFVIPSIVITILTCGLTYLVHESIDNPLPRFIVVFIFCPILLSILMYCLGLSSFEKSIIKKTIHHVIK